MTRLLVVGDVILDRDVTGDVDRVCPDAPAPVLDVRRTDERPGGAGLAALLLAGGPARQVRLATCVGEDQAGMAVRAGLAGRVPLVELARLGATRSVTRLRSRGRSLVRMDTAGQAPAGPLDVAALAAALADCDAVLVADYGAGIAADPGIRGLLGQWARRLPVVWDPHPRGLPPVPGTMVATPNRAEVTRFATRSGRLETGPLDIGARALRQAWQVRAVAATDGAAGVYTALADSPPLFTPAPHVATDDTCGAGDRFAGTLTALLAEGNVITDAVGSAVQDVADWLAGGGVGSIGSLEHPPDADPPPRAAAHLPTRAAAIRASGGTVVATGGCFDVLHAGHVACLQAARRLGDCLVVLLNSDAAVRRLKGPDRPVHPVADRIAVLRSLSCVDDVIVFDEDTPARALDRLRPDVWTKGGDYADATLPEAELIAGWGGRTVLLPYLPGRSTTRILASTSSPASPHGRPRKA